MILLATQHPSADDLTRRPSPSADNCHGGQLPHYEVWDGGPGVGWSSPLGSGIRQTQAPPDLTPMHNTWPIHLIFSALLTSQISHVDVSSLLNTVSDKRDLAA